MANIEAITEKVLKSLDELKEDGEFEDLGRGEFIIAVDYISTNYFEDDYKHE